MLADLSPLHVAALGCAALAAACWLGSIVTGNYSQVDRLWSIAPSIYVAWFASRAGFADLRLDVMLVLTILWGARLTYNFARKGGYRPGSEDYRWAVVRKRAGRVGFQLFNATFIAPVQNGLLLLLALPAWVALEHRAAPFGALDVVASAAFLLFFAGESIADQQQWRFQSDKHARKARGEAVTAEFLTTGLFRFSRHPNFFCEMGLWWSFALFGVAAGGGAVPSMVGAAILTALFQGSTGMTERLSVEKYPSYAEYQRTTSRLVPMPPRGSR